VVRAAQRLPGALEDRKRIATARVSVSLSGRLKQAGPFDFNQSQLLGPELVEAAFGGARLAGIGNGRPLVLMLPVIVEQPSQPLPLHCWVKVTHKQDVDVSLRRSEW